MQTTILRDFTKYVSLSICGIIGLTCYILADTFFIAQGMGSAGMTAFNLALPLFNMIFAVGVMLGTGGATKFTILRAQGRGEEANRIYTLALAGGLGLGLAVMAFGVTFVKQIPLWLGADEEVYPLIYDYLWMLFRFAPFFILNQIFCAFVRNDGAPRLAMAAQIAGSLFNIVFDYIFIFPMGLGMFGAALATGASPLFSMLVLSLHYIRKKHTMHLTRSVPWKQFRSVCALGLSAFINEVFGGLVIMVFNFVILGLTGNLGVAAYGVVTNHALVVTCLYNGIGQGMQPLVSDCHGRGRRDDMTRLLRYGLVTALALTTIVYAFTWWQTDLLIAIFNSENDLALAELAGQGLRIYFAGFFFTGVNVVMTFYYSASERPVPAFVVSAIRGFAVIIPMILLLSWLGGMTGTWLAYGAAEAVALLTIGAMTLTKRRASRDRDAKVAI